MRDVGRVSGVEVVDSLSEVRVKFVKCNYVKSVYYFPSRKITETYILQDSAKR